VPITDNKPVIIHYLHERAHVKKFSTISLEVHYNHTGRINQ